MFSKMACGDSWVDTSCRRPEWSERGHNTLSPYAMHMRWKAPCKCSSDEAAERFPPSLLLEHVYDTYEKVLSLAEKARVEEKRVGEVSSEVNPTVRRAARQKPKARQRG